MYAARYYLARREDTDTVLHQQPSTCASHTLGIQTRSVHQLRHPPTTPQDEISVQHTATKHFSPNASPAMRAAGALTPTRIM